MFEIDLSRKIGWMERRQTTIALAILFALWYVLQHAVLNLYGEDTAIWWFYFEKPPNAISPGIILSSISHDLDSLTHIGSNVLFLLVAGGLVEPYIRRRKIVVIVVGLGYLGTMLANATALIHQMWMIAGASGGVLALVAYSGLRMRHRLEDYRSTPILPSPKGMETIAAVTLLLGTPVFLAHQLVWIETPHSGHIAGILLGYLYFIVEQRNNRQEN